MQEQFNPSALYVPLPEEPIGDVSEMSLLPYLGVEEGDIVYNDEDSETGAPRRKRIPKKKAANKLATGTASPALVAATSRLHSINPNLAKSIASKATVRALSRNDAIAFEHAVGAKMISSTLGPNARLRPSEVEALQSAIYLSTPFEPRVFQLVAGPPAVLDVVTSLNTVIGTANIRYAGIQLVFAAATLNINQGAPITITRKYGNVNAILQQTVTTWQLEQGIASATMTLLNAVMIAGAPRLFMPQVAGAAVADATTEISIAGVPANYVVTARFLQPGDGEVDKFLKML